LGKSDSEAAVAKPNEDGFNGCHPLCLGISFDDKALATSGLLVEKLLTTGSLLAFVGGTLVKETLATSSLLAVVSSALVKKAVASRCLLVGALILPQVIRGTLPELVGGLHAILMLGKRCPPQWRWWQQPCGLFVFANGAIQEPIVAKCPINHPVRGAQRRLQQVVVQPIGGIKGGVEGRGQMSQL
jgi:hypothetical protein